MCYVLLLFYYVHVTVCEWVTTIDSSHIHTIIIRCDASPGLWYLKFLVGIHTAYS